MKAIIPVAGVGSRLRPHTFTLPKVLLNVAGKPILGHILDSLQSQGITEAAIIVGYMGKLVEEYVRDNYSISVEFIEQEQLLGLGHSIWSARDTLGSGPIFIILGDTIFDVNLELAASSGYSSLGVKSVADPRRFGVVEMSGKYISNLVEKPENPTTDLALVGLYYIKNTELLKSSLDSIIVNDKKNKGEYQLTDALQIMIDRGEKFTTFSVDGWYDCGKPETILSTNRYLLNQNSTSYTSGSSIVIPPVYISPSATVERSVIGPYTTIAENANISDSIIRNSIIGDNAVAAASILEESIIGNNAVVRGTFGRMNVGDSSEIVKG